MSSPPVTEPSAIIRYQQLATLRKFINKHKSMRKPNEAIIVVGDLNVNGRPPYDPANPASATGDSAEYKLMMKILRGEGIDAKLIDPGLPDDATEHMRFVDSTVDIRDLLKESYYNHPVTFGDIMVDENGHLQPRETVLAAKHDYCAMASLDYILSIDEKSKGDVTGEAHFVYDIDRTKIEEFFVKGDYPFTQLSGEYREDVFASL